MSFARRSLQVVAIVCTFVVGAASMALIVTQTTWFKEWLRGFIVRQAEDYVNGQLHIGRLDGNLFFGVRLADVEDHRQLGLLGELGRAQLIARRRAVDQQCRGARERGRDVDLHRLAAIAVVAGAQRAIARDRDQLAGAGADRAQQLDIDPRLAQRGPRQLAEQVRAMRARGPRAAAQT